MSRARTSERARSTGRRGPERTAEGAQEPARNRREPPIYDEDALYDTIDELVRIADARGTPVPQVGRFAIFSRLHDSGGRGLSDAKTMLLDSIERDRDRLVEFLAGFIRARSPNPPGDTLAATAHVCALLDAEGITYKVIDPEPTMPNIVASFEGSAPGPHLVLNGHTDVFPVGDEAWQHDPWSGAIVDDRIWGRGASDMKCGTSCSIWTYIYLHRMRDKLKGRLTLTVVSDEETFGPWARGT